MTRAKAYAEAGRRLTVLIAGQKRSTKSLATSLKVSYDTLRGYMAGFSAPRATDPIWGRLADTLGSDAMIAYRTAVSLERSAHQSANGPESNFESLMRRGRLGEAVALLARSDGASDPVKAASSWEQVARAQAYSGDQNATESFGRAVAALLPVRADHPQLYFDVLDAGASFMVQQEQYTAACRLIEKEIERDIGVARLWRRLGHVQWYASELVSAYASLNTALGLGYERPRILHARGQVLTELGLLGEAISDLEEVLFEGASSEASVAFAKASYAAALHGLGKTQQAWHEFEFCVRTTPANAWLHWRMAKCYANEGTMDRAADAFRLSLEAAAPRLNMSKRQHAQKFLGIIE